MATNIIVGGQGSKSGKSTGASLQIVDKLPETGVTGTIYLVPATSSTGNNKYDEYVFVNGKPEVLGMSVELASSLYQPKGIYKSYQVVTQEQYDSLEKDGNTIYVIRNGSSIDKIVYEALVDSTDEMGIAIDGGDADDLPTKVLNGGYAVQQDIVLDNTNKQDKLIPGKGIEIEENVIKCTLDTSLYSIVTNLPEEGESNKIYLVESNEQGEQNIYVEYSFINGQWEQLGLYRAEINLEPYALKTELPEPETYVLNFNVQDGVNEGAYSKEEYDKLRSAIQSGKLIIIGGTVTRVTADSQAMAADYVVIRYSTPRISDDSTSVTISFYELKFGILTSGSTEYKYASKAIHKQVQ